MNKADVGEFGLGEVLWQEQGREVRTLWVLEDV